MEGSRAMFPSPDIFRGVTNHCAGKCRVGYIKYILEKQNIRRGRVAPRVAVCFLECQWVKMLRVIRDVQWPVQLQTKKSSEEPS